MFHRGDRRAQKLGAGSLAAALAVLALLNARASAAGAFDDRCAVCHQANAQGIPATYPPLADWIGNYARLPQGRGYLARVVTHGLSGAIEVKGQQFMGLMPPFVGVDDSELAAALNEALTRFNSSLLPKDFRAFTAGDIAAARAGDISDVALLAQRRALLAALHRAAVRK